MIAILVKIAVVAIFVGEAVVSWLYLTGRRQQRIRDPFTNQFGIAANAALALGVLIWL